MLLFNSYTESKQLAYCCFQSVAVGLNTTLTWNTNVYVTIFGLINQLNKTTNTNTNTYCIICPESCVQSMMTLPIYNLCQLICIVIIHKSSQGRAEKNYPVSHWLNVIIRPAGAADWRYNGRHPLYCEHITTSCHHICILWQPPLLFVTAVTMNARVLVVYALVAVAYATTDADVKEAARTYVADNLGRHYEVNEIEYKTSEVFKLFILN